MKGNVALR